MRTALRRMGNSTGLIVPRALLAEIGVQTGAAMDVQVEDGRLVVTPLPDGPRTGWAEDAAALGPETDEEQSWHGFGNDADADLKW